MKRDKREENIYVIINVDSLHSARFFALFDLDVNAVHVSGSSQTSQGVCLAEDVIDVLNVPTTSYTLRPFTRKNKCKKWTVVGTLKLCVQL